MRHYPLLILHSRRRLALFRYPDRMGWVFESSVAAPMTAHDRRANGAPAIDGSLLYVTESPLTSQGRIGSLSETHWPTFGFTESHSTANLRS